ncbi:hypothetical protein [Rhodopirellula halodulae]|uniref:hypothetical protein n=1 Tax=Rhodopirellula halodulae TaxID=2894198 RepID=UPI001E429E03|nr:hypothetical protein [Rhodopirellula sp. JC737]MCC9656960.1 hypothetical protein [Rhodopirellula sp. JC737]
MCTRLSLLFAVVFSLMLGIDVPTRSLWAQRGMDMGMGDMMMMSSLDRDMRLDPPSPSELALKVTILLGPDYDFETKPFMTVQDVLKCFPPQHHAMGGGMGGMGGMPVSAVQYRKPTSGLIDLDMKLSIPDKPERHVIARMPEGLKEEDVDSWKRKIRLKALRFGLNRVTFLPSDFSISKDQSSIWLQVPVGSQATLKSNMEQHVAIALDLAESSETSGRRPRIDLFFSQELMNRNPFADPNGDPFARGPAPSAQPDPFSARPINGPFAAPPANIASISKVVEKTQRIRQQIAKELESLSDAGLEEASSEDQSKAKERIKDMFIQLEVEQIRMKQLHIQQLEKQLQQISESIEELSRPEAVEQRVQKQLELLENKLE